MFITQLPGSEVLPQKIEISKHELFTPNYENGYNNAVSSIEKVELVWDDENLAKEIFEVCTYPSPNKWEYEPEEDKKVWRYRASIISDNAHLFLSLRRSE